MGLPQSAFSVMVSFTWKCVVVQVHLACSPDKETYMIIGEPETCTYVCVLYHPSVCSVDDMDWRDDSDEEAEDDSELSGLIAGNNHEEL